MSGALETESKNVGCCLLTTPSKLKKGERMFTFQNIYNAYLQCRKGKRNTINALKFEQNLIANLWDLTDALQSRRYEIGASICFLTTSPKLREVFAADFGDRIVHHVLVAELEKIYEPKFISDVYNNRKTKGIHRATQKAQSYMNSTYGGYYLQLDIKGFFYNLDKDILYRYLYAECKGQEEILYLAHKIIYHDPTQNYIFKGNKTKLGLLPPHKTLFGLAPNKGLPIGNLTSQFFANVYMSAFDNYIKRVLKVKHYIRYVDDFVLFDSSKERLAELLVQIERYLGRYLSLTLRADTKLKHHKEGLDFLGYIIRPDYILTRRRVVNNYKYKKAKYLQRYEESKGKMKLSEIKAFLSVKASFESHTKHSNSYNLNQKIGAIDENNPFDYDRA